jgi:hypothetical protein
MCRNHLGRIADALALVGMFVASPSIAQEAAAQEAVAAERGADEAAAASSPEAAAAIDAVELAGRALARWQKAIEGGATVRDEDLARFKEALLPVGANVESILDGARPRRAERAPVDRVDSPDAATEWTNQMRTLGEGAAAKRAAVVEQLHAALKSDDASQSLAALRTLQAIGDVNYDKAAFRPLVLPFVEKGESHTLVAACHALFNTQREAGDLKLIQDAWSRRSPALDNEMSRLLFMYGDGAIEGRSEEIVLELLDSPHADVRRAALSGLWGANVPDRLAERIVKLADDPESHHDAIYYALSTFKPKNPAVVDKLIETLTDPDWNNWSRALWGLGYGVPRELQPKVAAALTEMYTARSDPKVRETCRELIRQYGGAEAAEALPR